ncbi:LapA family protein [Alphaproteobacteria bacterium]|nr:LapA family protein [Alphaproteobacteria bacterium]
MRTFGRLLWLSTTLLLVMFAIAFATSNKTLITLYLWPFDSVLTAPSWLLILSSFIIGGLLSAILLWGQWLAIRAKMWRLEGSFNKLQAETDKITAKSTANQDDGYQYDYDQQGEPATSSQFSADRRLR